MVAITRKRGDTYADEIIVKSAKTGLAVNITGYSFTMTLDPEKAPLDNTNNLYALVGTILDAPNGRVEFAPSSTQSNQTPGTYFYDVQMIDGAGRKRTIALDKYKYEQDISKV
jgi:hypothetical protein